MLLKIGEKTYPVIEIRKLPLSSVVLLQRELASTTTISSLDSWSDILAALDEIGDMSNEERSDHPESLFLLAVTVWGCRVAAGERLSLLDACDVPVGDIEWILEPGDRLSDHLPKGGGAGKAQAGLGSHPPAQRRTGGGGKGKKRQRK